MEKLEWPKGATGRCFRRSDEIHVPPYREVDHEMEFMLSLTVADVQMLNDMGVLIGTTEEEE